MLTISQDNYFNIVLADSFRTRLQGLIGRNLERYQGLLFLNCNALHTWFMAYALDIIFIDEYGLIIEIRKSLQPWRFCSFRKAKHFLEIPSHLENPFQIGDSIYTPYNVNKA